MQAENVRRVCLGAGEYEHENGEEGEREQGADDGSQNPVAARGVIGARRFAPTAS